MITSTPTPDTISVTPLSLAQVCLSGLALFWLLYEMGLRFPQRSSGNRSQINVKRNKPGIKGTIIDDWTGTGLRGADVDDSAVPPCVTKNNGPINRISKGGSIAL